MEVAQIARTISKALRLNEELTEAIALGHDLGHTPFGHSGEEALNEVLEKNFGIKFYHHKQSLRIVEVIEKDGKGLNLCQEVLDGIYGHGSDQPDPITLEGKVVKLADRFAYLRHDIEDAIEAKVLTKSDLPKSTMKVLGENILDVLVSDVINNSLNSPKIKMNKTIKKAMNNLYAFMYENVYTNPEAKKEEKKIPYLIHQLFRYYHYNKKFQKRVPIANQLQHTIDFIAGMTDCFAINKFQELFVPREWKDN